MTEHFSKETTLAEFSKVMKRLIEEKKAYFVSLLSGKGKRPKPCKIAVVERNLNILQRITEAGLVKLYEQHRTMLEKYGHDEYSLFTVWNFPKDYTAEE